MKKQLFTTVGKRQKLSFLYTYTNISKRNFKAAMIVGLYSLPRGPPCPYAPPA